MKDDYVSRRAILDKIKEVCFSKEWIDFRVDFGSNGQRDYIIKYIESLPSVEPTMSEDQRPTPMKFLKMIRQACSERGDCVNCPFIIDIGDDIVSCMFVDQEYNESVYPCNWELEKVEEHLHDR